MAYRVRKNEGMNEAIAPINRIAASLPSTKDRNATVIIEIAAASRNEMILGLKDIAYNW